MQQILKGQTAIPIEGYSQDIDRRWSRAFVKVQTPSTALPDTWTIAAIDNTAKTTQGASVEGATSINLSAIGSITNPAPGDKYIIDCGNSTPLFTVQAENYGSNVLYLRDPLPQPVPNGAAVIGYKVSYELDASHVTQEGQAIARWKIEDRDRVAHIWDQPFLIVNTQTNYTLTSDSLMRAYPIAERLHAPSDDNMTELIATAWRDYLRPDLEAKQIRANQIKSWERLEAAHAAACVYHLILTDERQDPIYVETWRNTYAHQMDLLFAGREFWYAETDPENSIGRADNSHFINRNIGR
tara:strand:- start:774 stop:1667 length:894 start_codon:yes stop_codon:yes gene_type:complete